MRSQDFHRLNDTSIKEARVFLVISRPPLRPDMTVLSPQTYVAQVSAAAAVLHVLKLEQQSIGIGEIQFGRAAFGAATIRHAQRDVRLQRTSRRCRACLLMPNDASVFITSSGLKFSMFMLT